MILVLVSLLSVLVSGVVVAAGPGATAGASGELAQPTGSYDEAVSSETDSLADVEPVTDTYDEAAQRRLRLREERERRQEELLERRRLRKERERAEQARKEEEARRKREAQEKERAEQQELARREWNTYLVHRGIKASEVRELLGSPNGIQIEHKSGAVIWRYWLTDRTFVVKMVGYVVVETRYELVHPRVGSPRY